MSCDKCKQSAVEYLGRIFHFVIFTVIFLILFLFDLFFWFFRLTPDWRAVQLPNKFMAVKRKTACADAFPSLILMRGVQSFNTFCK
ncbi:hypothetical protein FKM82_002542 [Ascaphus truei]